jgi:hypothetical protein
MMTDHDQPQASRTAKDLLEDEGGVVFVEYLTLASMVTILGAGCVFVLGLPMVRLYEFGSMLVTIPLP